MRMQIFSVKKPSCKILKMKNCVPFEVQYTSSYLFFVMYIEVHNVFDSALSAIELNCDQMHF